MIDHIKFGEALNVSPMISIKENEMKKVYILSQSSLINNNIDIHKLINNQLSTEEKNSIKFNKLNFNSDEVMALTDFYIVDKSFINNFNYQENPFIHNNINSMYNMNISNMIINNNNNGYMNYNMNNAHNSNDIHSIYYYTDNSNKYLIFPNEEKILTISPNKSNINNINNDIRNTILTSAVLLYANEKELDKLFASKIIDEYELKKYYLVNKAWIEAFKNAINYKEIYNILSQTYQCNSYKGYEKNMESFYSNEKLRNILGNIYNNILNNLKNEIQIYPQVDNELSPINFELIPKSLFNLLKQMANINEINQIKLKHNALIGNLDLFIQSN